MKDFAKTVSGHVLYTRSEILHAEKEKAETADKGENDFGKQTELPNLGVGLLLIERPR